jgi:pilus assembly protein CpaE
VLAEVAPLLSQHLPLIPVKELNQYPDRRAVADLCPRGTILCLIDVVTDRDAALALLSELSATAPHAVVVALLATNDSDLILRVLRQGATEFLLHPFTADQLQPVLARISSISPGGAIGSGRILAVAPVKGACGASTLCSNLAFQAKRLGSRKILLADLDPSTGTLSFLLKVKSTYSFIDALTRSEGLDADLWRGLVVQHAGVDVLLSPENAMDTSIDLPDPAELIDFCRQAYEQVTLDLGGVFSSWSLSVMRASDEIILVTTNELPALRSTQRALNFLIGNGIENSHIRLVVNRYNPNVGLNEDAIETALRCKIFRLIPSDYESVQKALMEGKPISPGSTFGKSLSALANQLFEKPKDAETGDRKKSSWTSIFGTLLKK